MAGEKVSMAKARLAVSQSQLDGTGILSKSVCENLNNIAKGFDAASDWFSSCKYLLYGSIPDTDSREILKLSDGDYCATFATVMDGSVLVDYTFIEGRCGDARISVE